MTPDQPQADELDLRKKIEEWRQFHGLEEVVADEVDDLVDLITREREQAKRELLDDLVSYANFVDRGENPEDHAPFDLGSLHIYRINFRHPLTPNEPKEAE